MFYLTSPIYTRLRFRNPSPGMDFNDNDQADTAEVNAEERNTTEDQMAEADRDFWIEWKNEVAVMVRQRLDSAVESIKEMRHGPRALAHLDLIETVRDKEQHCHILHVLEDVLFPMETPCWDLEKEMEFWKATGRERDGLTQRMWNFIDYERKNFGFLLEDILDFHVGQSVVEVCGKLELWLEPYRELQKALEEMQELARLRRDLTLAQE